MCHLKPTYYQQQTSFNKFLCAPTQKQKSHVSGSLLVLATHPTSTPRDRGLLVPELGLILHCCLLSSHTTASPIPQKQLEASMNNS